MPGDLHVFSRPTTRKICAGICVCGVLSVVTGASRVSRQRFIMFWIIVFFTVAVLHFQGLVFFLAAAVLC